MRVEQNYDDILILPSSTLPSENGSTLLFPVHNGAQQGREKKILNHVAEYDFAPAEFEGYLRSLDVDGRDNLEDIYIYLVKAYKKHGLAEDKRRALDKAVFDHQAAGGQYTLWLIFLSEQTGPVSADVRKILESSLGRHNFLSDYQLKLTARIYAKSGDMKRAVEVYRLLGLRALNSVVRFNNVVKFTALSFVKEINQYLKGSYKADFIREIIQLVKPPLKDEVVQQENYNHFILKVLAETIPAGKALAEIEKNIKIGKEEWSGKHLFDYAGLLLNAGRKEDALNMTKQAILNSIDNRPANQVYGEMLGIRPVNLNDFGRDTFTFPANIHDLFSAIKTSENRTWLMQATKAMKAWSGEGVTRFMLFIAYQMQEAGATDDIKTVMVDISDRLGAEPNLSPEVISLALAVSAKSGYPLRLSLMQKLLREGRLPLEYVGQLVERTLGMEGSDRALSLGEEALTQTHNDGLLTLLIAIAEQQGDSVKTDLWRGMLRKERDAHEALKIVTSLN